MTMIGTAFRAPKQSNLEQWQKVRLLVEAGFLFHRHSGPKPRRLKDVPDFLEAQRLARRSPGERLLDDLQQRATGAKTSVTKAKAQGRVKRLNTEGRPRFELQGRELQSWARVLVRVNGEWHEGHVRFTGDGGKPVEANVRLNNGQIVFISANTVLRWPD